MHTFPGLSRAAVLLSLALVPHVCPAVDTAIWQQNEQADFARGTPKHVSIRSDGHVTLAPVFKELDSTNVPYLWSIARDSKGTLYYAGGGPTGASTKVYALAPGGKSKVFAELTALEVHALAVDAQDRVYAAVMPDAKIYRLDASGKPQLFFDPKCKYIWAMTFDRSGNLFVASGDSGLIYKVTPDGKGSEFFHTEETHARSLALDAEGNLIVGTEPGGLVIRITPAGQSFILYQTSKREVTSVAIHDGIIYAASVGNKPAGSLIVTGPAPVLPATPAAATGTGAVKITPTTQMPAAPAIGSLTASVSGGSELYRIQKDGFAERIWSSPTDLIYAIAFDGSGKPLLGTGNKGLIYRIDSDNLSTQLLNAPPTQVTSFLQGQDGIVYAVTGNVGNLYAIGPGYEKNGNIESDVLDASAFARWGKVHLTATHQGGITLETRSGNVNRPQNNWSPWTKVNVNPLGGQIESPAARFLQYRLTLTKSSESASPDLNDIEIAYLPKNIAPKIHDLEMAPFNYREAPTNALLEASTLPSGSPSSLTLPAVGQKRSATTSLSAEGGGSSTLQYRKGFLTARWNASDANGDSLTYRVEIKGKNDTLWRTLKEKLQDKFYSFDSTAFADGEYILRVTASDAPGNTPADALTTSLETDPFTIDNTPPEITDLVTSMSGPVSNFSFTARDALSWIDKAEYSINGGDWTPLEPQNAVTDSQVLKYQISCKPQELVAVRIFDEDDNVVVKQFTAH